jgi:hypothetical protein
VGPIHGVDETTYLKESVKRPTPGATVNEALVGKVAGGLRRGRAFLPVVKGLLLPADSLETPVRNMIPGR